jgi:hypothetical protein
MGKGAPIVPCGGTRQILVVINMSWLALHRCSISFHGLVFTRMNEVVKARPQKESLEQNGPNWMPRLVLYRWWECLMKYNSPNLKVKSTVLYDELGNSFPSLS